MRRKLKRSRALCLGAALGLASGCGRSMIYDCVLEVSPTSLDFGTSAPDGGTMTHQVTVSTAGTGACYLSGVGIAPGGDPGFSVTNPTTASFFVQPGSPVEIQVAFAPEPGAPYVRHATLAFQATDRDRQSVSIPLSGALPKCTLSVAPASIDLGMATLGSPTHLDLTLSNDGGMACDVTGIGISAGSDPGFDSPGPTSLSVAPGGAARLPVTFEADQSSPPYVRKGTLTFQTGDPASPSASVPLTAQVPKCSLGVSPSSLSFGNVLLNGKASGNVTLSNDGGVACDVTSIALESGSDPDFSLPATQPLTVAPGASAQIPVDFADLSGGTPPLLRQGTLSFATGDPSAPSAAVPLSAYVSTICTEASRWIYTVESNGTFARFDPDLLTFTDLGTLSCPAQPGAAPFSMAVDQNAVAWVIYTSGELFQVDTQTAVCQPTAFVPDQAGVKLFGMSFVFQPTTGQDTLYVAGGGAAWGTSNDLATIAFPSLTLSTIAPVSLGSGELAGTGDGELWDFIPAFDGTTGISILAQLDPTNASALQTFELPQITASGGFATKFYGGAFWIFLGPSVYEVQRATGVVTTAIVDSGRDVVGAGVSTCAPIQGP